MARFLFFIFLGVTAGAMITLQSVVNAGLGRRAGNLGSVLLVTLVSIVVILILIGVFPAQASLKALPGPSEWYLYLGGALGIAIVAAPVILVPRIGATATLTSLVVGQLVLAVLVDHFGLFGSPKVEATLPRLIGVVLLLAGAALVANK
jgi:bacterial/archaeal transporter family-2 protein